MFNLIEFIKPDLLVTDKTFFQTHVTEVFVVSMYQMNKSGKDTDYTLLILNVFIVAVDVQC